jgi:hypothetical protein
MKVIAEKKQEENFALPGRPMTEVEFVAHMKDAEKGPFVTLEEGNREFEAWKKTRKK